MDVIGAELAGAEPLSPVFAVPTLSGLLNPKNQNGGSEGQVVGTADGTVIIVFPDGQTCTFLKSYVKPVRIVSESDQSPGPERAPA